MLEANATVRVGAAVLRPADGRLAAEHGRLEHLAQALLRAAAAVLSLRLRPPERDRLARRARGARGARSRPAPGAPPSLDRRGRDPLRGVRRRTSRRIPEVGDAWLDAGIVHFSTLGWESPRVGRGRQRDRGRGRPHARRPPRPCLLGGVVPGRLGVGEPRADPPVVLLAELHGGDAGRSQPVPLRPRLREGARRDRTRDAQVDGQRDRG